MGGHPRLPRCPLHQVVPSREKNELEARFAPIPPGWGMATPQLSGEDKARVRRSLTNRSSSANAPHPTASWRMVNDSKSIRDDAEIIKIDPIVAEPENDELRSRDDVIGLPRAFDILTGGLDRDAEDRRNFPIGLPESNKP